MTTPRREPSTQDAAPPPGAVERHRRKWWALGLGLLSLAFYRSLQPLPVGPSGGIWPPDGNARPEVVLARLVGLVCVGVAIWGSKRHIDRQLARLRIESRNR